MRFSFIPLVHVGQIESCSACSLLLCTQFDCHKQSTKWEIEGVICSKDAAVDENTQQCKRQPHTDFWFDLFCIQKPKRNWTSQFLFGWDGALKSARGTTSSTFGLCVRIYGRMHRIHSCMRLGVHVRVRAYVCVLLFFLYVFQRTHTKISEHTCART